MPDNKEIRYEYTGSVSSLKKATKDAIKLLGQYEAAFQKAAGEGNLSASKASVDKFTSSVNTAVQKLQMLSNKLKEVESARGQKNTIAGERLSSIVREINSTLDALKSTSKLKTADLNSMAAALKNVSSETSNVTKNLSSMFTSFGKATSTVSSGINSGGDAGSILGSLSGTGSSISGITGILQSAATVFEQFGTKAGASLGSVATKAVRVASVFNKWLLPVSIGLQALTGATKQSSDAADDATESTNDLASAKEKLGSILGTLKSAFTKLLNPVKLAIDSFKNFINVGNGVHSVLCSVVGVFSAYKIGKLFASAAEAASDMAESINLFTVAMKDSIAEGNIFINTVSEMYGLDPTNLMQYTGVFYEMAYAVGVPTEAAANLSMQLTSLTTDLASLWNYDFDKVAENLTSGVRGMTRAVVKYGMDVRNTTVEAYARSIGVTENFETMNEASREILRFLVMAKQATDSMGDLAATIEQPANQMRILKEQTLQLGRVFGRYLINMFAPVLPVLNGIIMALRLILEAIADFIGIWNGLSPRTDDVTTSMDDAATGVSGVGDAAGDAAKKLKDLVAPFDELNILAENTSSSLGGVSGGMGLGTDLVDPRILAELDKVDVKLQEVRMRAHDVRDAFLEFFGLKYTLKIDPETGEVLSKIEAIPGQFADRFTKAIMRSDYTAAGKLLSSKLGAGLLLIDQEIRWEAIQEKVVGIINTLSEFMAGFFMGGFSYNLGQLVGHAFDSALRIGITFLEKFPWGLFGRSVAEGLNAFVNTGWITQIGTIIGDAINSAVQFLQSFTFTFDWNNFASQLAESINNFFETVSWGDLGRTASVVIRTLLETLVKIIIKTDWFSIGESLATMLESINWLGVLVDAGRVIIRALFGVMMLALGFVGELVGSLIGQIATLIKDAGWKIVLGPVGTFVITKLWDSFKNAVGKLKSKVYEVVDAIVDELMSVDWINKLVKLGQTVASEIINSIKNALMGKSGGMVGSPGAGQRPGGVHRSAAGGVFTGPRRILIGEGAYDEAVIPLGEAPQMMDFINKIADATKGNNGGGETVVKVYIGDKEWDAFTYKSAERGKKLVGAQPVKEES